MYVVDITRLVGKKNNSKNIDSSYCRKEYLCYSGTAFVLVFVIV